MKTTAFIAFSLFALLLFAHMPAAALAPYEAANAIDATLRAQAGEGTIGEESGIYAQGWLNDWRAAGIIAVAISLALVALAYIFGFALNSREMKMWAGIELAQVFGSMIIIAGLLGIVTFFDVVAAQIAQGTMEAISYGKLPKRCKGCKRALRNTNLQRAHALERGKLWAKCRHEHAC